MPMKRDKYPVNWRQISASIRERAYNRCEVCGVANGAWILRSTEDKERFVSFSSQMDAIFASGLDDEFDESKPVRVVLTVHHKDFNPANNDPDNLICVCQLHHNRMDVPHRRKNAGITRREKKRAAIAARGQLELFGGD